MLIYADVSKNDDVSKILMTSFCWCGVRDYTCKVSSHLDQWFRSYGGGHNVPLPSSEEPQKAQ